MKPVRRDVPIRVRCLTEPHEVESLDIDHLVDELTDGTPPSFLTPERLCVQDLVVTATEPESGRYLGLLAGRDQTAGAQRFLRLEIACVAPSLRGRRMMSILLARAAAARLAHGPVLAARTGEPSWFRALRHFAAALDGSGFHPAPTGAVIALRTAAAAREIAAALCPEHRYDLSTGVLHGRWSVPAGALQRHVSADAWCETARDTPPLQAERLLAVVDLRDVAKAPLLALARRDAVTG
jgi:hypothetical protein